METTFLNTLEEFLEIEEAYWNAFYTQDDREQYNNAYNNYKTYFAIPCMPQLRILQTDAKWFSDLRIEAAMVSKRTIFKVNIFTATTGKYAQVFVSKPRKTELAHYFQLFVFDLSENIPRVVSIFHWNYDQEDAPEAGNEEKFWEWFCGEKLEGFPGIENCVRIKSPEDPIQRFFYEQ